ncbi:MAG: hypothetical protein PHT78_08975 [Desulfitobacteriaceae bacterium]|nr:hypothetical protein [Desulfitobacteriaceae bacterium]
MLLKLLGGGHINKYLSQLFKEMYYHEIDQKEKLNTRITIPFGFITILGGLGAYYASNISNLMLCTALYFFIICISIYAFNLVLSIYYLWHAYTGYDYDYLPFPQPIEENFKYWIQYYEEHYNDYFKKDNGPFKNSLIEEAFEEELVKLYKVAIETNRNSNQEKTKWLRLIAKPIMIAFIAGILAYIPFYMSLDDKKYIKVEVVNSFDIGNQEKGGVIMSEPNNSGNNPPKIPPPPKPPKLEVVKIQENFEK